MQYVKNFIRNSQIVILTVILKWTVCLVDIVVGQVRLVPDLGKNGRESHTCSNVRPIELLGWDNLVHSVF